MKVEQSPLHFLGGLIVALSFCQQAYSFGASGKIEGFNLNSCGKKNCITITAPKASIGMLNGSYGFDDAQMIIQSKAGQKSEFHSKDLYYDFFSKKVFIRSIAGKPNQEAYYDLETEKLFFYPVEPSS